MEFPGILEWNQPLEMWLGYDIMLYLVSRTPKGQVANTTVKQWVYSTGRQPNYKITIEKEKNDENSRCIYRQHQHQQQQQPSLITITTTRLERNRYLSVSLCFNLDRPDTKPNLPTFHGDCAL